MTTAGRIVAALTLLGLVLLIPRLGQSMLWDPWEPKYVQTAREMTERGDWVVPHYRHDERLVKPPLTYWLIAASRDVFGETEFASRLPSAVLALLAALALALALCRRGLPLAGAVAGGALLTAPQFLLLGRFATPDMPLAAIGALLLAAALAWPRCTGRARTTLGVAVVLLLVAAVLVEWPRGWLLPAWCVLGWGAFRNGRRGVGLFAAISTAYAVAQFAYIGWLNVTVYGLAVVAALGTLRVSARIPLRRLMAAAAAVVALAAPWFVAVYRASPDETVYRLLGYKHGINLGETLGAHMGPPWYPLLIAGIGALPWMGAAVAALVSLRAKSSAREAPDAKLSRGAIRVAAGAWLGLLTFYTLSEAQMGHFYGVLQPAAAALAGLGLVGLAHGRGRRLIAVMVTVYLAGAFVAFDPSMLLEGANVFKSLEGQDPWILVSAACVVWAGCVTIGWTRQRASWMVLAVLPVAVLSGTLAQRVVPSLDATKSLGPIWQRYQAEAAPGEPLGTWDWTKDSIFYYSNNGVPRLHDAPELADFLAGAGGRYMIAPYSKIDDLRVASPPGGRWELLDDRHPYQALLRYRRPQPESR